MPPIAPFCRRWQPTDTHVPSPRPSARSPFRCLFPLCPACAQPTTSPSISHLQFVVTNTGHPALGRRLTTTRKKKEKEERRCISHKPSPRPRPVPHPHFAHNSPFRLSSVALFLPFPILPFSTLQKSRSSFVSNVRCLRLFVCFIIIKGGGMDCEQRRRDWQKKENVRKMNECCVLRVGDEGQPLRRRRPIHPSIHHPSLFVVVLVPFVCRCRNQP